MLDTFCDVMFLLMSIEEVAVGVVMLSADAKMTQQRHREEHGELQEEEGEGERARRRRRRRRRTKRSLQPSTVWRYLLEN